MRAIGSREFNQDVSHAKRLARIEPVVVTDRGRPTHVLLSIEAFRKLSGQQETIVELLSVPEDSLDEGEYRAGWAARRPPA